MAVQPWPAIRDGYEPACFANPQPALADLSKVNVSFHPTCVYMPKAFASVVGARAAVRLCVVKLVLAFGVACLLPASPAGGVVEAWLLDDKLQIQPIRLAGVSGDRVGYFDEQRQLQREPIQSYVMLEVAPQSFEQESAEAETASSLSSLIKLTDGQRIAGRLSARASDEEDQALGWWHPTLGQITVGLDRVASYQRLSSTGGDTSRSARIALDQRSLVPQADRVLLVNGDVVEGYLVSLMAVPSPNDATTSDENPFAKAVLLRDGETEPIDLPLNSIDQITLANPLELPEALWHVINLRDGSRLLGGDLKITSDSLSFSNTLWDRGSMPLVLPITAVASVEFAGAGMTLASLDSLEWEALKPARGFGRPVEHRVLPGRVEMHSPTFLTMSLPPGASRMARTILLDLPSGIDPVQARWADVVVEIYADFSEASANGGEPTDPSGRLQQLVRVQLDAQTRSHEINLDLTHLQASRLWWVVREGKNGPVLDRVALERGVLLVRRSMP